VKKYKFFATNLEKNINDDDEGASCLATDTLSHRHTGDRLILERFKSDLCQYPKSISSLSSFLSLLLFLLLTSARLSQSSTSNACFNVNATFAVALLLII